MKKTFWLVVLLAASALCMAFGLTACDPSDGAASEGLEFALIDENFNPSDTGTAYCVAGIGECKDSEIVIPSEYEGKPVIAIGNRVFYKCDGLTSVIIPDSVTKITDSAFYGCSSLISIRISNKVSEIGHSVFYGCSGLKEIIIPDSVTKIGSYAFSGCSGATEISIPEGVTQIDSLAFEGCSGLTSVTIPDSVTSIGGNAFDDCSGMKEITIGSGMASFGTAAFSGCGGLKKVHVTDLAAWCNISFSSGGSNPLSYAHHLYMDGEEITTLKIPKSVTSIGRLAFNGCSGLTSVVIPDSVNEIGYRAFYGCSGLTEIQVGENNPIYHAKGNCLIETASKVLIAGCKTSTIPDDGSVTSIGNSAFAGCEGLTDITIPDSVTSIGYAAFDGCSGLTSVIIPDSVTSIGDHAFSGTDYYNDGSHWTGDVLYIGNHLIKAKDTISGSYSIRGGTMTIAGDAFYGCKGLTEITIPDSVTSIGTGAFEDCNGLTSVTIPDSVTSIGIFAFFGCSELKEVYFENPSEWGAGGNSLSGLDDPAKAAEYLTWDFREYTWERETD